MKRTAMETLPLFAAKDIFRINYKFVTTVRHSRINTQSAMVGKHSCLKFFFSQLRFVQKYGFTLILLVRSSPSISRYTFGAPAIFSEYVFCLAFEIPFAIRNLHALPLIAVMFCFYMAVYP